MESGSKGPNVRTLTLTVLLLLATTARGEAPRDIHDKLATLEPALWQVTLPGEGSGIKQAKDGVILQNRCYLWSKSDWKSGSLEVEALLAKNDGELRVLLHCNANRANKAPYDIFDGVRVTVRKDGVTIDYVIDKKVQATATAKLDLDTKEWQKIRLTDDGKTLAVAIGGKVVLKDEYGSRKELKDDKDRTRLIGALFGFTGPLEGEVKIRNVVRKR